MTEPENEELAIEDHIEMATATAKVLPKLVELLMPLPPVYRRKAVEAAIVLLQDVTE